MVDVDYRAMVEDFLDAVVVADADGVIVSVNRAAEQLLGWPRDDLVGLPLTTIQPERMRARHMAGFRRYLDTREPRLIGKSVRVPALHRDGTELDIELSLSVQRDGDGADIFVGALRDVRERVELERQVSVSRYLQVIAEMAARLRSQDGLGQVCAIATTTMVDEFDAVLAQLWLAPADADRPLLGGEAVRSEPVYREPGGEAAAGIGADVVERVAATGRMLLDQQTTAGDARLVLPLRMDDVVQGVLACRFARPLPDEVVVVLATLADALAARLGGAQLFARQQHARQETEEALERAAFLGEAARILSSSLDYEETLARVARLAVETLADWCVVHIATGDGSLRRVAVTHRDPAQEELVWQVASRYPVALDAPAGPAAVFRTGEPELVTTVSDSLLQALAPDAQALALLRQLGLASYVSVPLEERGRTFGVLTCIAAESARSYSPADVVFLQRLAAQAALAVDNARLFTEVRVAKEKNEAFAAQLDMFFASAPVGLAFLDTDLRYVRVNDTLAAIDEVPADELLGHTATEVLGDIGRTVDELRRKVVATGHAVTDAHVSGRTRSDPERMRHWTVDYYPVRTHAGELLGIGVIVDDVTERKENEAALARQQAFSTAVLENLREGIVACDAEGNLTVFNQAAQELHGLPIAAMHPGSWARHYRLFMPDGVMPMAADDIPLLRALRGEVVRDVEMIIAPQHGDRRVVLCNGQALHDDVGHKLGAVVTVHDITQRKHAEERLARQALHDPLTALPNRLLLLDRMRQALARADRRSGSPAVLFLDFDRFKVVNDSLGHDVGDQVLIAIAERLRSAVRPADTVARLGGDEFVVLCEDFTGEAELVRLCDRLEKELSATPLLKAEGTEVIMTASVGVAMAHGGERPEDLLRNADAAMYRAKERGRARHELFDDSFRVAAVDRLRIEHGLRHAIEHNRLRLLYQPVVDLRNGTVVGAEALVRYLDPDRGLVAPAEFLNVAEDTGLIVPMGAWIIREACRQTAVWRTLPDAENVAVFVNLSARQLADPGLVGTLEDAVTVEGLPAGAVALEITETALIEAAGSTLRVLDRLKGVGAQLGIDDFGTGYSSLTYLRRFPVDFVKVDQSFVQGLGIDSEDSAIVTAVVALSRSLGLATVAEGIETAGQAAMLRDLDCDLGQGYHFARPQPPDTVSALITRRQPW